ncbi:MAG: GNAT family N-acetyltransferase [Anaerolineae bacterium]|nr:GNAT family N-acetyltransferase [Anaerolineae bacterium]
MVAEFVAPHAPALTVQPSQPEDRAAIYDVLMTSGLFGKTDAECVDEMFTSTWKALEADLNADTYRWLSCFADQKLAGFACFGTESLTHNTWDLFWVCVRPEARGKGVARALMQEVITQAKVQGGRLMVIYTSSTAPYAPARALYESQGFVRTAVVPEYYNVGDDLYIYSKRLKS